MSETIRILIADDHTLVRKGIRMLLSTEPGMEVVAEASDGFEAASKARLHKPDVILMDLVMPRMGGLEAIEEIVGENPAARILVLTSFSEDAQIFPAIKAGALGYLLKDSSPDELIQAIRRVYQGEPSLHPAVAIKLMRELRRPPNLPLAVEPLTEREVEVLKWVARGMSNQEIAESLVVSERTVANHIGNILAKLHLANRTQAALWALREGVTKLGEA